MLNTIYSPSCICLSLFPVPFNPQIVSMYLKIYSEELDLSIITFLLTWGICSSCCTSPLTLCTLTCRTRSYENKLNMLVLNFLLTLCSCFIIPWTFLRYGLLSERLQACHSYENKPLHTHRPSFRPSLSNPTSYRKASPLKTFVSRVPTLFQKATFPSNKSLGCFRVVLTYLYIAQLALAHN